MLPIKVNKLSSKNSERVSGKVKEQIKPQDPNIMTMKLFNQAQLLNQEDLIFTTDFRLAWLEDQTVEFLDVYTKRVYRCNRSQFNRTLREVAWDYFTFTDTPCLLSIVKNSSR